MSAYKIQVGYKLQDRIRPLNSESDKVITSIIKLFQLGQQPKVNTWIFRNLFFKVKRLLTDQSYTISDLVELCSGRSLISWLAYWNQVKILKSFLRPDYFQLFGSDNIRKLSYGFNLPLEAYRIIIQRGCISFSFLINETFSGYYPRHYEILIYYAKSQTDISREIALRVGRYKGIDEPFIMGPETLNMLKSLISMAKYDLDLIKNIVYLIIIRHENTSIEIGVECLSYLFYIKPELISSMLHSIPNNRFEKLILKMQDYIDDREVFWSYFEPFIIKYRKRRPQKINILRSLYEDITWMEWIADIEPLLEKRFSLINVALIKTYWVSDSRWDPSTHKTTQPPRVRVYIPQYNQW